MDSDLPAGLPALGCRRGIFLWRYCFSISVQGAVLSFVALVLLLARCFDLLREYSRWPQPARMVPAYVVGLAPFDASNCRHDHGNGIIETMQL